MNLFFLQSQGGENPKSNSLTYPRRLRLSLSMKGSEKLQVEDKVVADTKVRQGMSSPSATKSLFRAILKISFGVNT